jgi:hypothetical protein
MCSILDICGVPAARKGLRMEEPKRFCRGSSRVYRGMWLAIYGEAPPTDYEAYCGYSWEVDDFCDAVHALRKLSS